MAALYDNKPGVRRSSARSIEACRRFMRVRRLSLRTEKTYIFWIHCYIRFHNRRPETMASAEVEEFLTDLALRRQVAPATQNVAFNALLYLYREILGIELRGYGKIAEMPEQIEYWEKNRPQLQPPPNTFVDEDLRAEVAKLLQELEAV